MSLGELFPQPKAAGMFTPGLPRPVSSTPDAESKRHAFQSRGKGGVKVPSSFVEPNLNDGLGNGWNNSQNCFSGGGTPRDSPMISPKACHGQPSSKAAPPTPPPPQLRSHRQQWFHPKWKNQLASMTMECIGSYLVVVWYGLNLIVFCDAGLSYFG